MELQDALKEDVYKSQNKGSVQADDEASDNISSDLAATGAVEDNKADNLSLIPI